MNYYLDAVNSGGIHLQDIELDRDEYIMLKRVLAIYREHVTDAHINPWALERLTRDDWKSNKDFYEDALETCREILEADSGCSTPFESFFTSLVTRHTLRGVTPDEVEKLLEDFRADFKVTAKVTRRIVERYPDLAKPEKENANV